MERKAVLPRILLLVALLLPAAARGEDFRMGDYRAPTPLSLDGARIVDTEDAARLVHSGAVLPLDVLPVQRNAETGAWLQSKPRMNIPGSIWLPNVGYGALSPALEHWFRTRLDELTGGSRSTGMMFYCVIDCWMSWNAAKRAVSWGYRNVVWYPEGTDGWSFDGLPLAPATLPDPAVPR